MVKELYIPERGDLVWLDFEQTLGHEQKGRRPALVITHKIYNQKAELALVCPITSTKRKYPFAVPLEHVKISGVILADQIRAIAWKERKATRIGKVSTEVMHTVVEKLETLISL